MNFKLTAELLIANAIRNVAERKQIEAVRLQTLKAFNARVEKRKSIIVKPFEDDDE